MGVTASAIYYEDYRAMEGIARLFGRVSDADRYARRAAEIGAAFHARFFDPAKQVYGTGSQTANAMPLALGITPGESRPRTLDALVNAVRARGNHVSSGEIGHPYLIRARCSRGAGPTCCST